MTTPWLPLWQCSHCLLVPDTVTAEQWLHRGHTLLGICYHGAYIEICLLGTSARSLHGKTLGTLYTQSLCRNQGGTNTQFCSLPLVPLVGERIVTTSSLSSHSTVTIWGVSLCNSCSIIAEHAMAILGWFGWQRVESVCANIHASNWQWHERVYANGSYTLPLLSKYVPIPVPQIMTLSCCKLLCSFLAAANLSQFMPNYRLTIYIILTYLSFMLSFVLMFTYMYPATKVPWAPVGCNVFVNDLLLLIWCQSNKFFLKVCFPLFALFFL